MLLWIKRLIVTITSPFLKMLRSIKTKLSLNRILIKANQTIVKFIGSILSFRPQSYQDYFDIDGLLIAKKLVYLILLLLCVIPIVYFTKVATPIPATQTVKEQYEEKTFYYNDMALEGYTGKAIIKNTDNTVVYRGDVAEGLCSGQGIVYDLSGRKVYEGELLENKYNGKGKQYDQKGELIYEGDFIENLYEGNGTLWNHQKGQRYEGSFVSGKKEGTGTLYRAKDNRIIYTGDFSGGVYDGYGTLYNFVTGEYYEGNFVNGKKEGEGILYDKKGRALFTGTYGVDFFEGDSRRYFEGNLTYIGPYKDGKKEGQGQEFDSEGNLIYEGGFSNGQWHGIGKLYNSKEARLVYEGEFVQGKKQGQGKLYDEKGREIFEGQFFKDTIDLSAYLGASWEEIEAYFKETPEILCSNEATYLVYSQLHTIFVLDGLEEEEAAEGNKDDNKPNIEMQEETQKQLQDSNDKELTLMEKIEAAVRKDIKVNSIILLGAKMMDCSTMEETNEVIATAECEALASCYIEGYNTSKEKETVLLMTRVDKHIWEIQDVLKKQKMKQLQYSDGKVYYEIVFKDEQAQVVAYSILSVGEGE